MVNEVFSDTPDRVVRKLLEPINQSRWMLLRVLWTLTPLGTDVSLQHKLYDRYGGYHIDLIRRVLVERVILAVYQLTDSDSDSISIGSVASNVFSNPEILAHVRSEWADCVRRLHQDSELLNVERRLKRVQKKLVWFQGSSRTRSAMIAFRNEWIAHRSESSRETKRIAKLGVTHINLTYARIWRASLFVVGLAYELQNILSLSSDAGFDEQYESEASKFWRLMINEPNFEVDFGPMRFRPRNLG